MQQPSPGGLCGSQAVAPTPDPLDALYRRWPCREAALQTLVQLLGRPCDPAARLLVSGPAACGKTGCVLDALSVLGHRHARASLAECHTPRLLFETLLRGLAASRRPGEAAPPPPARCASLPAFVSALRQLAPTRGDALYCVLDEAWRLGERRGGPGGAAAPALAQLRPLLPALLALDELTGCNVGVVFVSVPGWDRYRAELESRPPLELSFKPYGPTELARLLAAAPAPPLDEAGAHAKAGVEWRGAWPDFAKLVTRLFPDVTNLTELRALAAPLWARCTRALLLSRAVGSGPADARLVCAELLAAKLPPATGVPLAPPTLALGELEVVRWADVRARGGGGGGGEGAARLDFDLPSKSKFLLIAAYIAARTAQARDSDAFRAALGGEAPAGAGGRRGGKRKAEPAHEAALRGPESVSLERLLALFQAIASKEAAEEAEEAKEAARRRRAAGERRARRSSGAGASPPAAARRGGEAASPRAGGRRAEAGEAAGGAAGEGADGNLLSDVMEQITSLCELGLLARTSADPLDAPRFRCAVSAPLARLLAANAGLMLAHYLPPGVE